MTTTIAASIALFIALVTLMMGIINIITQSIIVIMNKTKRDIELAWPIISALAWATFYYITH